MRTSLLPLLLVLAVAGCAPAAPVVQAPGSAAAEQSVTATGYLVPHGADGRLLAIVNPWRAVDIDHAVLVVSVGGSTIATLTVPHANVTNQITIGNLKRNTNYSILAQAYNTSDSSVPIDTSVALPASCTTTFSTAQDAIASIGSIALQLADRAFAGTATNALSITPGNLVTGGGFTYTLLPTITTLAGVGTTGHAGDGAAAASAQLFGPYGVAVDGAGNLYIGDNNNQRVRLVCQTTGTYFGTAMTAGNIYTVAGNGTSGATGDGGAATSARLANPNGVATDASGNLYIADFGNYRVRMVCQVSGTYFGIAMTTGNIYTVAGNGVSGFSGDGAAAIAAKLKTPVDVTVDPSGNLYIADVLGNRIRKVDTGGTITTFAGNGTAGFSGDGAAAASAKVSNPGGVGVDAGGNVYIADTGNGAVRKVTTGGVISTVAGTGNGAGGFSGDGGAATSAQLDYPTDVAVDASGKLFIIDQNNQRIRQVSGGTISTLAGNGTNAFAGDGGAPASASLSNPQCIAVDATGGLYFSDQDANRVRRIR